MMFHPLDVDGTDVTALQARAHVAELEAERGLARHTALGANKAYMADLDAELELTLQVYAVLAVTEIASLRAELSGPQMG